MMNKQIVLADPEVRKRCLRSRAAYRDKNRGCGELKAKCRVVALGHTDPDLFSLTRSAPTPGRLSEQIMYCMITAGHNAQLGDTGQTWTAWIGDASTAFLQGSQPDGERPLPLFLWPPKDRLIQMTKCWTSRLYRVKGNIYGLSNGPYLWCMEVVSRLTSKGYQRHRYEPMLFLKFDESDQLQSAVLVYVDDFIGVARADYNLEETTSLFKGGERKTIQIDSPVTFKGQELTLTRSNGVRSP